MGSNNKVTLVRSALNKSFRLSNLQGVLYHTMKTESQMLAATKVYLNETWQQYDLNCKKKHAHAVKRKLINRWFELLAGDDGFSYDV